MKKHKISIRLSALTLKELDSEALKREWSRSQYLTHLIWSQSGPEAAPNGGQSGPKAAPKRPRPSRTRETNPEKNIKNPLVSPKGELVYFSSLFQKRPEYDTAEFKSAWEVFVGMRADRKTKPPAVTEAAAERFAKIFEKFSPEAAITALTEATLNEWAGIFPKELSPTKPRTGPRVLMANGKEIPILEVGEAP